MSLILRRPHEFLDAHEILPGLWQGSHIGSVKELDGCGFNVLVRCAQEKFRGQDPESEEREGDIKIIYSLFDDTFYPSGRELQRAYNAAGKVAELVQRGAKVLVTCNMGRNRSGLVAALAVVRIIGCPGREARELVQFARPMALDNRAFVSVLENLK